MRNVLPFALLAAVVIVPGDSPAPSVAALGPLDGAQAFGISADLSVAAAAIPLDHDRQRSLLRISRGGEAAHDVVLPGRAVALAIAPTGHFLLVAVQDLARKGDVLGVRLLRFDVSTLKVSGFAPLPSTAAGIAFRNGGDAVLVASRDEVRTFLLPALASGALYRVPGDNRAVAPIAGSTRVLVAQPSRLVLVDLAGAQGRAGLAVMDEAPLPGSPRALVSSPEAPEALLLEEDGSVLRVSIDPLLLSPAGHAVALAWPGTRLPAPATPLSPPPDPGPAPSRPDVAPAAPVGAPEALVPPAQVAVAAPLPMGSISGRVVGPNGAGVAAVVAFGPDNILREAARIRPDPDGGWRIDSLPPGSYRFVAVGEGGRVLICDPPYVNAKVGPDEGRELPVMNILGEAH